MTDGVVVGFDFGAKRIGVALGNTLTREARPYKIWIPEQMMFDGKGCSESLMSGPRSF